MEEDMRQIMRTFFSSAAKPLGDACWSPSADIYQGQKAWLVKLDLAGVNPADIQVRTCGRRLVVEGQRRDHSILEGQTSYSMEISYNRFQRSIELPFELETARIQCEYRDGMFLLVIEPQPKDQR